MIFVCFYSPNSSATISAPPTTNNANSSISNSAQEVAKPPAMIASAGTTSKIMHPPEDLSLEEIRARKPKYIKQITIARANAINFASSNAQHHQKHSHALHQQAVSIAQEVFMAISFDFFSPSFDYRFSLGIYCLFRCNI